MTQPQLFRHHSWVHWHVERKETYCSANHCSFEVHTRDPCSKHACISDSDNTFGCAHEDPNNRYVAHSPTAWKTPLLNIICLVAVLDHRTTNHVQHQHMTFSQHTCWCTEQILQVYWIHSKCSFSFGMHDLLSQALLVLLMHVTEHSRVHSPVAWIHVRKCLHPCDDIRKLT